MTAGEAADQEKTMPRAGNNVIWRILVFYIGAILIRRGAVAGGGCRGPETRAAAGAAARVGCRPTRACLS